MNPSRPDQDGLYATIKQLKEKIEQLTAENRRLLDSARKRKEYQRFAPTIKRTGDVII